MSAPTNLPEKAWQTSRTSRPPVANKAGRNPIQGEDHAKILKLVENGSGTADLGLAGLGLDIQC